jgi:hypothetical protein
MARSDLEHSSDDSSGSNDQGKSSTMPNSQSQLDYPYATDADSAFDGTLQKKFEEEDGQFNDSISHDLSAIQAQVHSFSQFSQRE